MSTQTDFEALVVRIDAATDRLEMDVMELEKLINDAEGAVSEELAQLVAQAQASANAAQMSAQTATQAANSASTSNNNAAIEANRAAAQVALAQDEVTKAKAEVVKATQQADRAKTEADRAKGIADTLLASAPFQEAPKDGRTYGRKDAAWVAVEGGGSGGTGTVTSVNGIEPDNAGNVSLTIPTNTNQLTNGAGFITLAEVPDVDVPTKTSELTNDSGFITAADIPAPPVVPTKVSELENDSDFATVSQLPTKTSQLTNDSAFITLAEVPASPIATDAPADGKQYARKDNAWSEVESSGSGGSSYTLPIDFNHASDGTAFRFYVNHTLFPKVEYSGYEWNNAATISAINPADWNGDATKPLTTNPWNAVDIRLLSVKKVDVATGAVIDDNLMGTTVSGGSLVSQGYAAIWGNPTGATPGAAIAMSIKSGMLPGKWYIPAELMTIVSGQNNGLPTAMTGYYAMLEVTNMPLPGSAAFPFSARRNMFLTFWNLNKPTASKMVYMWQQSGTWINIGTGTN